MQPCSRTTGGVIPRRRSRWKLDWTAAGRGASGPTHAVCGGDPDAGCTTRVMLAGTRKEKRPRAASRRSGRAGVGALDEGHALANRPLLAVSRDYDRREPTMGEHGFAQIDHRLVV